MNFYRNFIVSKVNLISINPLADKSYFNGSTSVQKYKNCCPSRLFSIEEFDNSSFKKCS